MKGVLPAVNLQPNAGATRLATGDDGADPIGTGTGLDPAVIAPDAPS
jgi:hypothetical protein